MLTGLDWTQTVLLMLCGVLLDLLLGEPRRFHPLVGFGKLAAALERRLNRNRPAPVDAALAAPATPAAVAPSAERATSESMDVALGTLAWLLAVLPLVAIAAACIALAFAATPGAGWALHALLLYFTLGLRSLRDHNLPIADALKADDLPTARALTGRIVSRDTQNASADDLAKASTESLLENGNDAVFGALFWFAIAGGPGALLFRLANTLDAMWGYRTPRFLHFGRAAARIDDALNFIPARLTAASYALLAPTLEAKQRAFRCWRAQAPAWSSPNAGPVMSAGAGALGLSLGGPAIYNGELEQRPPLGEGKIATKHDIVRAWRLVLATCWLWLAAAAVIAGVSHA
ncbi:CobD/CbiB family cobalamin biosynthesis protein [Pseudoduganella sp. RAF19]|uniref:CobD/CbiB family cobalamin biosynthesis protein n=3 Tax=unclassified Pseudoduganella TaxID=2637179 RepID=UPI003F9B0CE6